MKHLVVVIIALLFIATLAGCGGEQKVTASTEVDSGHTNEQTTLSSHTFLKVWLSLIGVVLSVFWLIEVERTFLTAAAAILWPLSICVGLLLLAIDAIRKRLK